MIHTLGDRAPEFEGSGHFIADNATLIGTVRLRDRASIWYNCVLRGDNDWIDIGKCSNESLIGIGSTVLNGARIGRHTIVGAHALVTEGKEFPDGVMLLGAPARIARELTDEEIGLIRYSAKHYAENAARYLESLAPCEP